MLFGSATLTYVCLGILGVMIIALSIGYLRAHKKLSKYGESWMYSNYKGRRK